MILRISLFIAVLLTLLPLCVEAGGMEGRLAYRKGDFATVLKEFESKDQRGPVGSFFLALMYLRGEGVSQDRSYGLRLLREAADDGYSAAQYLLGRHLLYGTGVPQDKPLAMSYLLAAAADDDQRAVALLKRIEQGGRSEKKDAEQVTAAIKRKAKAGVPDAQYTLGFMYLIGDGVPKNGAEEVRWYRAAAGRSARAAFMLSIMHQYGEGVQKSSAEAFRLMRIAAELGDPRAQYYLGTYYYQGIGTAASRRNAATWFRSSAEKGYADAQFAYGMLLLAGDGLSQDKGQAVEWLGKASGQGNAKAKELLRDLLTYRGQPAPLALSDAGQPVATDRRSSDSQVRLEGQGVLLDQGTFGLKFSLPTLYDAYAPQGQTPSRPLWEKFQGGTFDIIFRSSP